MENNTDNKETIKTNVFGSPKMHKCNSLYKMPSNSNLKASNTQNHIEKLSQNSNFSQNLDRKSDLFKNSTGNNKGLKSSSKIYNE